MNLLHVYGIHVNHIVSICDCSARHPAMFESFGKDGIVLYVEIWI